VRNVQGITIINITNWKVYNKSGHDHEWLPNAAILGAFKQCKHGRKKSKHICVWSHQGFDQRNPCCSL
jgi:hypothetical protein